MIQSGIYKSGRGVSAFAALVTTLSALTLLAGCTSGGDFRGQADPPPEVRDFVYIPEVVDRARVHTEFCAQGNRDGFPCDGPTFPIEFCAQGNRGGRSCNSEDFHLGRIGAHHAYGWDVGGGGIPVIYPEGGVRIGVGGTGLIHDYPKIRENLAVAENTLSGDAAFRALMQGLTAQYYEFDDDFSNRNAPGVCGAITDTATLGETSFDNCFPGMADVHGDYIVHVDDLILFDPDESWSGGVPAGVSLDDLVDNANTPIDVPLGVSARGGTRYDAGDLVLYEGRIYRATRPHVSVFVPNASGEDGADFTVNTPVTTTDIASSQPDLRNEQAPWREVFLFSYIDRHCENLGDYDDEPPGTDSSDDCRMPTANGNEKKFFVDFGDGTEAGRDLRVIPDASGLLLGNQSAGIVANERNPNLIGLRTPPGPESPFHGVAFAAQLVPHVASRALDAECTTEESYIANPMYAFPGDPVAGDEEFMPCLRPHTLDAPVPNYSFSDRDSVDDYLTMQEKEELAARLGLEVAELDKLVDPTYDFVPADFQNDMTRYLKCEQGQNRNFFSLGCLVELSEHDKAYLAPLLGLDPDTADDHNFLERSSGELTVAERARFLAMADPDETKAGDIYFRAGGADTTPVVYYDKDKWLADYIEAVPGASSDTLDDAVDVFLLDVTWKGNGAIPSDPDCAYSYPRPAACDDGDDATVVTLEDEYRIHKDFLETHLNDTLVSLHDFFSRRDNPLMVVRSGYRGFDADPFRTLRAAVIQQLDPDLGPNLDPADIDPYAGHVFCYDRVTATYSRPLNVGEDCAEGFRKLEVSGDDMETADKDELVITITETYSVVAPSDDTDCAREDSAPGLPGCQFEVVSAVDLTNANDGHAGQYSQALNYAPDRRGGPRTLAALPYYFQAGCGTDDVNCRDFRGSLLTAVALDSNFYSRVVDEDNSHVTWLKNITEPREDAMDDQIFRKTDDTYAVRLEVEDDTDGTRVEDWDVPNLNLFLSDNQTVVNDEETNTHFYRDRDDTPDGQIYRGRNETTGMEAFFVKKEQIGDDVELTELVVQDRRGDFYLVEADETDDMLKYRSIHSTDPRHPDSPGRPSNINRDQLLHDNSPRCGPLPEDWNARRDGRHYCLSAPGAEARVNDGWGGAYYRYEKSDLIDNGDESSPVGVPKPGTNPALAEGMLELPFADRDACEEGLATDDGVNTGLQCVIGDVYYLQDEGSFFDVSDYSAERRTAIKAQIDAVYPTPGPDSPGSDTEPGNVDTHMKLRDSLKSDVDGGLLDTGFSDRSSCETLVRGIRQSQAASIPYSVECVKNPRLITSSRIPVSESDFQPDLYAASYLAGSLALLDERFRGQLSGKELGLRLVNTADNREAFGKLSNGDVETDSVWYKIASRQGFVCDGDGIDGFMDAGNPGNKARCADLRVAVAESLGVTDVLLAIADEIADQFADAEGVSTLPAWRTFFDIMDTNPGVAGLQSMDINGMPLNEEWWRTLWACFRRDSAECTNAEAIVIADSGSLEAFTNALRQSVTTVLEDEVSREILETYGAGLIDLDRAMNCLTGEDRCTPRNLSVRAQANSAGDGEPSYSEFRLGDSAFYVDVPFGDGLRASLQGQEIALFDDGNAPFWYPMESMIRTSSSRESLLERRYHLTAGSEPFPLQGGGVLHWSAVNTDGMFSDNRGTQRWASLYNALELDEDYQLRFSLRQPIGAPDAENELLVALGDVSNLSLVVSGGDPANPRAGDNFTHPYLGFAGEGIGIGSSRRLGDGRLTTLGFSSDKGLVGDMLSHSDEYREAHGGLLEYGFSPVSDLHLGLHAGAMVEEKRALGLRTNGGFGDMGASTTAFAGMSLESALPGNRAENWRFRAQAFGGMTRPSVPSAGLIADWSRLVSSSFRIGFAGSSVLRDDDRMSFFLEQPLRVESGSVAFMVPVGRTVGGEVLHQRVDGALAPSGRELEFSGRYELSLDERTALTLGAGMVYEGGHSVSQETEFYGLGDLTFRF